MFEAYNTSVFPMQIVLLLLATAAVLLAYRGRQNRVNAGILGILWLWTGSIYHILFFSSINGGAYLFGILFIIQGILFLSAALGDKLSFRTRRDNYGILGSVFILYALIIYPILNHVFGHGWPNNPTFGLPCPTTIFTFGLLLWTDKKVPKHILIIPLLWSLLGVSAAVNLGIWEDTVLVAAGISGTLLLWMRDRKK